MLDILVEYEDVGSVDIARWVERYPALRDEIIDFWTWLKGSPRVREADVGPFAPAVLDIAEEALRNATLSINLGSQWLEPAVDSDRDAAREALGVQLEVLRRQPWRIAGKASTAFRKAVVWTWVASIIQTRRSRVTRLGVQKATYLLENAMELKVFVEHEQKPLGPYDHRARYADAEPIAIGKGWLKISGASFRIDDNLAELRTYLPRYVRSQHLANAFIEHLAAFSDSELETLATVHWLAKDIILAGRPLTVANVEATLSQSKEWRPKLDRPNFSRVRIGEALTELTKLRLVPNR
jgi:hypothetical protein